MMMMLIAHYLLVEIHDCHKAGLALGMVYEDNDMAYCRTKYIKNGSAVTNYQTRL